MEEEDDPEWLRQPKLPTSETIRDRLLESQTVRASHPEVARWIYDIFDVGAGFGFPSGVIR